MLLWVVWYWDLLFTLEFCIVSQILYLRKIISTK